MVNTNDTERNEEAHKLPPGEDRAYGPYGQQRPDKRPEVDEDDVTDDKREEAWQGSKAPPLRKEKGDQ